jgi:hypothetical protein
MRMTVTAAPNPRAPGGPSSRPHRLPRVAGVALVVVLLAGLAALAFEMRRVGAEPPPVDTPSLPRTDTLQPPAPPAAGRRPGQPAMGGPGWRATSASSISGVLMVIVETDRLDEMAAIAREVVTPAKARLLEALVYFHRPGASRAMGRVQWTPDGGYVPLTFSE